MAKKRTAPARAARAARPAAAPQKGGSLTLLVALLILVGVADLLLWGLVGFYVYQGSRSQDSAGTVQSASNGAPAQSVPDSAPAQSLPDSAPAQTSAGGETAAPAAAPASDEEKRDALLSYIQSLSEIERLETETLASYGSVSGSNYTDDAAMYAEISEHTVPLGRQLDAQAVAIVPSDPEIAEVHGLYRDYVTKYLNALTMLTSALSAQDAAQAAQANDLINEANDLAVNYQQALRSLAEARGIALNG